MDNARLLRDFYRPLKPGDTVLYGSGWFTVVAVRGNVVECHAGNLWPKHDCVRVWTDVDLKRLMVSE